MKLLDLPFQLAYYKAYHMDSRNVRIHLYCIPLILATALVLVHPLGLTWPVIGVYALYYVLLDAAAGAAASAALAAIGLVAGSLYARYSSGAVLAAAAAVHVVSWALQFLGHFHYEHRSPAVLDNPVQPLVLAPYLVLFELLFMLGLRKDLQHTMMARARELRNMT